MNIHKSCAKQVEEVCIGQLHKKDRSRDTRFSAILGKIISDDKENKRKISHINAAQSKYLFCFKTYIMMNVRLNFYIVLMGLYNFSCFCGCLRLVIMALERTLVGNIFGFCRIQSIKIFILPKISSAKSC